MDRQKTVKDEAGEIGSGQIIQGLESGFTFGVMGSVWKVLSRTETHSAENHVSCCLNTAWEQEEMQNDVGGGPTGRTLQWSVLPLHHDDEEGEAQFCKKEQLPDEILVLDCTC